MMQASEEGSPECCLLLLGRIWCVVKECGEGADGLRDVDVGAMLG